MKKLIFLISVLFIIGCQNDSQLNIEYNKLVEIKQRQLEKIEELSNQKNVFISQIRTTKEEIKSIVGNTSQSYDDISNNVIVNSKLKIIQRRLAYSNKLNDLENQSIQALQITNVTLEDIKDKIALGNILDEKEFKQILEDIDQIKNANINITDNVALNINPDELESYENIWANIIQGENQEIERAKSYLNKEKINKFNSNKQELENKLEPISDKKKRINTYWNKLDQLEIKLNSKTGYLLLLLFGTILWLIYEQWEIYLNPKRNMFDIDIYMFILCSIITTFILWILANIFIHIYAFFL